MSRATTIGRWMKLVVSILLGLYALLVLMDVVTTAAEPRSAAFNQPRFAFQVLEIALPGEGMTRSHPVALTYEPTGGYLYVAGTGSHEVLVISGTDIITTLTSLQGSLPCLPESRGSGVYCFTDIEAHPLTGYVYVTQWQTDRHYVISGTEIVRTFIGSPARWNGPVVVAPSQNTEAAYVGAIWGGVNHVGFVCGPEPVAELELAGTSDPISLVAVELNGNEYVYAAERGADQITVIQNVGTCEMPDLVTSTVSVGDAPTAVAVHPQTDLVYAVNGGSGDVSVISGTDVMTTVSIGNGNWPWLGPSAFDGYVVSGTTEIVAFGPETGYVYVPNIVDDTVTVISATEVIATLPVGDKPNAALANPVNGLVYVANTASNTVSIISGTEVVDTLAVAAYPIEMAVNPENGDVYVAGRDGNAISVIRAQIEANFTATPTTGLSPLSVSFEDQSQGNIDSWSWDFGDGATSTLQNPTHTYTTAGRYTVTLTVTGSADSDQEVKVNFITVHPTIVYLPLLIHQSNISTTMQPSNLGSG